MRMSDLIPDLREKLPGWHQPSAVVFVYTKDHYIVMRQCTLNRLRTADQAMLQWRKTIGMMWKTQMRGQTFLCWYDKKLDVDYRPVLIQEVLDLLQPPELQSMTTKLK